MNISPPLSEMSTDEKLQLMETLWRDLRETVEQGEAPNWHADVLRAREARVASGAASFGDWAEAKRRIRERTQ